MSQRAKPVVLSIAALDPSGGAGIAADLRTLAAEGAWGCAVMTAVTFQSTSEITGWEPLAPESIASQLETLTRDVTIDALKIGMVGTGGACQVIAEWLDQLVSAPLKLVIDPVLSSSIGAGLGEPELAASLREVLLPKAAVVTPNLDEAEAFTGERPDGVDDMVSAARGIQGLGPEAVLVTGGDAMGDTVCDVFVDGARVEVFRSERIASPNTHGTGCVLSTAIAAALARGESTRDAVISGRSRVRRAIERGFAIGSGPGPVEPIDL